MLKMMDIADSNLHESMASLFEEPGFSVVSLNVKEWQRNVYLSGQGNEEHTFSAFAWTLVYSSYAED